MDNYTHLNPSCHCDAFVGYLHTASKHEITLGSGRQTCRHAVTFLPPHCRIKISITLLTVLLTDDVRPMVFEGIELHKRFIDHKCI